jgi:hypothetical protein
VDVGGDADPPVAAPDEDAPLGEARREPLAILGEKADVAGALLARFRCDHREAAAPEAVDQLVAEIEGIGEDGLGIEAFEDGEGIVEDEEAEEARVARFEPRGIGTQRDVERRFDPGIYLPRSVRLRRTTTGANWYE